MTAGDRTWWMCMLLLPSVVLASGCQQEMADQPRVEAWGASPSPHRTGGHRSQSGPASGSMMSDDRRAPPAGTVPRGHLQIDEHLFAGRRSGEPVETFPFPIDAERLRRGGQRFRIYCTPCHGASGDGNGSVVERGFPSPPTFHSDRLRETPPGHLFEVISDGIGRMPRFSDRITVRDRWAIAAYIRALQTSQHLSLDDLPEREQTDILDRLP